MAKSAQTLAEDAAGQAGAIEELTNLESSLGGASCRSIIFQIFLLWRMLCSLHSASYIY